jgi:hypothetical protein
MESLRPYEDFPFLKTFTLSRHLVDGELGAFDLVMVFVPAIVIESARRLVLRFEGVRDLKVGDLEPLFMLRLEVRLIRDQQLEELNYKVVESEHDAFRFLCRDFSARVENNESFAAS